MAVTILTATKNEILNLLARSSGAVYTPLLNYYIRMCSGTQPADPATVTGVSALNSTGTLPTNATWGSPSGGVMVYGANIAITNNSGGALTPTFARIATNSTGLSSGIIDLPIGLVGSGAACIVDTVSSVANGAACTITNLRVNIPLTYGTASINTNLANKICEFLHGGSDGAIGSGDYCKIGYGETSYPSTLTIYDGTIPANADAAITGNLLATYTMANATEMFAAASGASVALASSLTVSPTATGTATHFRLTKTHATLGTLILQGTVASDGSADMTVDSTSFSSGVNRSVTALGIAV